MTLTGRSCHRLRPSPVGRSLDGERARRSGTNRVLCLLLGLGLVCLLLAEAAWAQPIPEFLGTYAVVNGKLFELKRHPQSGHEGIAIGGLDVYTSLSGISLP